MCNSNSLVSSTGYGFSMRIALLETVSMASTSRSTWSPISMTGFAKSVVLRLDYMNYHSWRIEDIQNLKIANCAHHIGRDSGIADELGALMYAEPIPPAEMLIPAPNNENSALITEAAMAVRSQYQQDMAKWEQARDLRKKQRLYDGVAVANAIAATCGSTICFLIDKEATTLRVEWQPGPLWTYLEVITKAALTPAKKHLEEHCP